MTGADQDVYLCFPKATGNQITIVNKCRSAVSVSIFGKKKNGNFVCSAADWYVIDAGKAVQLPMRQFEKLYLTTNQPVGDPYAPIKKSVFFGKKEITKMALDNVMRGSHYKDDECNNLVGNTFAPIVTPNSKYATYSLCHPIN